MRLEAIYWHKRGLYVTLEGSREEFNALFKKAIREDEARQYEDCVIYDLPKKVHLSVKVLKEKGQKKRM